MLQAAQTPLSAMDPATMRAVFNLLAAERGQPAAPRNADRFELGKGIALLRATSKPKTEPKARAATVRKVAPPRLPVIRQFALELMARVVAYRNAETGKELAAVTFERGNSDDDAWQSVGLSYFKIVELVKEKFPHSRISANVLRQFTHGVKSASALEAKGAPVPPTLESFRSVVLPERRPKSGVKPDARPIETAPAGRARKQDAKRRRSPSKKPSAKRRASGSGRAR